MNHESPRIDSAAYGTAYYAAIDPDNDKDTLEKWKVVNGYYQADAAGCVIESRFRDTKDLGYGRGMRAWVKPDGSMYFFVENFWAHTDWFNQQYLREQLVLSGIFDLNRYQNR